MVQLSVDWNPLVTAFAALIVALTPAVVLYTSLQVNELKRRQEVAHAEAQAERATLSVQLEQNKRLLEQAAITTPNTPRNRRESDK